MSNLIAISYPDVATAVAVRDRLFDLQRQNLITMEDLVVVERRANGTIKLHQTVGTTGMGAVGGALWDGLIGLLFFMPLFFMPLFGMALGAATGAASGAMVDAGVNDAFMRELADTLAPGAAALFVLVVRSTPDKVIPEIQPYGGRVIQTSLSREEDAQLREMIEGSAPVDQKVGDHRMSRANGSETTGAHRRYVSRTLRPVLRSELIIPEGRGRSSCQPSSRSASSLVWRTVPSACSGGPYTV